MNYAKQNTRGFLLQIVRGNEGCAVAQSVLEEEVLRKLTEWKTTISVHDRGVILGIFLSCFPLFPVALAGLIISLLNYWLWKRGRLDIFELTAIRKGIFLGILNTTLGLLILTIALQHLLDIDWHQLSELLIERFSFIFRWLPRLPVSHGTVTL
jgi:hypothetical protein